MSKLRIVYDGRIVVGTAGRHTTLSPNECWLLLELVHARSQSTTGYYMPPIGNAADLRRLVFRLRKRLKDIGMDPIQTGIKSYRVSVEREQIEVDESLADLPPGIVPPSLVASLLSVESDIQNL